MLAHLWRSLVAVLRSEGHLGQPDHDYTSAFEPPKAGVHGSPAIAAPPYALASIPDQERFDVLDIADLHRLDAVRVSFSTLIGYDSSPYAGCMFKPAAQLPYPRATIYSALVTLLAFARGEIDSPYLDVELRTPKARDDILGVLDTLDNYLDIPPDELPTELFANARIGFAFKEQRGI